MLKNDIEKTLQAHSPVPPEGFAERMDRKVISLMQQKEQAPVKKKSRYRKPAGIGITPIAYISCTSFSSAEGGT